MENNPFGGVYDPDSIEMPVEARPKRSSAQPKSAQVQQNTARDEGISIFLKKKKKSENEVQTIAVNIDKGAGWKFEFRFPFFVEVRSPGKNRQSGIGCFHIGTAAF